MWDTAKEAAAARTKIKRVAALSGGQAALARTLGMEAKNGRATIAGWVTRGAVPLAWHDAFIAQAKTCGPAGIALKRSELHPLAID